MFESTKSIDTTEIDIISSPDQLKHTYMSWANQQVTYMNNFVTEYNDSEVSNDNEEKFIAQIYSLSHDLKGLGGSFNYFLITDIGRLLCSYLQQVNNNISKLDTEVLSAHIDAFDLVLSQNISGTGGQEGAQIHAKLTDLSHRTLICN